MKPEIKDIQLAIPPGINVVTRISDISEVNERLQQSRWVLLGIVYTREVQHDGSFKDEESYIIGLQR